MASQPTNESLQIDQAFIAYFKKLESENNKFFRIRPITLALYRMATEDNISKILTFNKESSVGINKLYKLDFSTELFPTSTGALKVNLYKSENREYYIRTSGGCVAYRDTLYGPFYFENAQFQWPKELEDSSLKPPANPQDDAKPASNNLNFNKALLAIIQKNNDEFSALIKKYPEIINYRNDQKLSLLIYATSLNVSDCAKILISARADVNLANNEGMTPLMFAVLNKNIEIAKLLIENKANPDAKNYSGFSSRDLIKNLQVSELEKYLP